MTQYISDIDNVHLYQATNFLNAPCILAVKVYLLTKEEGGRSKPFTNNFQSQMYCKTWDAPTMMQLPANKDLIMPGEDCAVTITVRKHIVSSKLCSAVCSCLLCAVKIVKIVPLVCFFITLANVDQFQIFFHFCVVRSAVKDAGITHFISVAALPCELTHIGQNNLQNVRS